MCVLHMVTCSCYVFLLLCSGAVFFLVKYYVDKYNLLYAYRPSSSCGHQYLHKTASNFILVAALHLQLGTLLFTLVRAGQEEERELYVCGRVLILSSG